MFFCVECHVALDKNPVKGYNTLLLRLIPGDLLSACPHREFHTLPGLLDSRATLSNFYPNACVPSWEVFCAIFMVVFGMTRLGREPTTYRMRGGPATSSRYVLSNNNYINVFRYIHNKPWSNGVFRCAFES